MTKLIFSLIAFVLIIIKLNSQNVGIDQIDPQEKLDVAGGIKIQDAVNENAGTIQFNTTSNSFQGFNGNEWVDFGQFSQYKNHQVITYSSTAYSSAYSLSGPSELLVEVWSWGGEGDGEYGGAGGNYVCALVDYTGLNQFTIGEDNSSYPGVIGLSFGSSTLAVLNGGDAASLLLPGLKGPGSNYLFYEDPAPKNIIGQDRVDVIKMVPGSSGGVGTIDYATFSGQLVEIRKNGDGGSSYGPIPNGGKGSIIVTNLTTSSNFNTIIGSFPSSPGGGGSITDPGATGTGNAAGKPLIILHYN